MALNKVRKLEMIGVVVVIILGFVFHELYKFTGNNFAIGLISPINESKWEHWKIVFWPMLIYGIIEFFFIKSAVNNFWFSKAIAIIIALLITFGVIELYELIAKEESMVVHIISYVAGIVLGQVSGNILMTKTQHNKALFFVGITLILIQIVLLTYFTVKPLKTEYFKNSLDGTYGIYKETQ